LRLGAGVTIVFLGALLLILFRLEKVAPRRNWDQAKAGYAGPSKTGYVR